MRKKREKQFFREGKKEERVERVYRDRRESGRCMALTSERRSIPLSTGNLVIFFSFGLHG
jgi:hypothetical protein